MTKRETTPAVDPQNTVSILVSVAAPAAMLFRSWLVSVVSRFDSGLCLLLTLMWLLLSLLLLAAVGVVDAETSVPELAVELALVPICAEGPEGVVFPITPCWTAMVVTVSSSVVDGVSCMVLLMKMNEMSSTPACTKGSECVCGSESNLF